MADDENDIGGGFHVGAIYAAAESAGMLKKAEYPADKFPFLLRLMGLFRLSFPLDAEDKEHLVPALLSPDEAADCTEPTDEGRVQLRYAPRPIVRPRSWKPSAAVKTERCTSFQLSLSTLAITDAYG